MAIAWVKDGNAGGTGLTTTNVSLASVTAGNLITVAIMVPTGRTLTVSDDQGNTYTNDNTATLSDSSRINAVYSAIAGASATTVVSITIDGAGTRIGMVASEFSGSFDASREEASAQQNNNGGGVAVTQSSSGDATAAGDALFFGSLVGVSQIAPASAVGGTGYTNIEETSGGRVSVASKVITGGLTDDFILNHSSSLTNATLVIYKEAGGGGGGSAIAVHMYNYRRRRAA